MAGEYTLPIRNERARGYFKEESSKCSKVENVPVNDIIWNSLTWEANVY